MDVDTTQQATQQVTQQVTSQIPLTAAKNPKRVAAGKAIAEKRRQAREEQKKNWPRLISSWQTSR